jgi:hypothetical protein
VLSAATGRQVRVAHGHRDRGMAQPLVHLGDGNASDDELTCEGV